MSSGPATVAPARNAYNGRQRHEIPGLILTLDASQTTYWRNTDELIR